jgi:hypothetical protein
MNRHPVNAGKGRKKGSKNKLPRALKEHILQALAELGGTEYLVRQGEKNPNAFLALIGRVLPLQIKEGGQEPQMPKQVIHEFHES